MGGRRLTLLVFTHDIMSEAAAAKPEAAKPKKASKPKAPAAHPTYITMVSAAITALKERNGSSRQAVLKYIMANYKLGNDQKPVNSRLKVALRNGTQKGVLKNVGRPQAPAGRSSSARRPQPSQRKPSPLRRRRRSPPIPRRRPQPSQRRALPRRPPRNPLLLRRALPRRRPRSPRRRSLPRRRRKSQRGRRRPRSNG